MTFYAFVGACRLLRLNRWRIEITLGGIVMCKGPKVPSDLDYCDPIIAVYIEDGGCPQAIINPPPHAFEHRVAAEWLRLTHATVIRILDIVQTSNSNDPDKDDLLQALGVIDDSQREDSLRAA